MKTDVLVLGAGPAGLAVRAALPQRAVTTLEAGHEPGGLLRVYPRNGYIFDTVVHLLSLRDEPARSLIHELCPDGLHPVQRDLLVWQRGRVIPYPYQYHAAWLDPAVAAECLAGYRNNPSAGGPLESLGDWLRAQFGPGFYQHFFGPYNHKLYGTDPDGLEAAQMVWTVPADDRTAVEAGAAGQGPLPPATGFYPRGPRGIATLVDALCARGDGPLLCGDAVVKVDLARRYVYTASGKRLGWQTLVSTLPLSALVDALHAPPPEVRAARTRLDLAPVTVVHVGLRGCTEALPACWTYFPDPELPFYRLTRLERITPDMCPQGHSAIMLECPGDAAPPRAVLVDALVRLGVAENAEAVQAWGVVLLPAAYVRFRPGHEAAVATIEQHLARHDVHSTGRYGAWRYANIEQTLAGALETARSIQGTSIGNP